MPAARDVIEFVKPVTRFALMWAFARGAVSSAVEIVLSGPLLCASSQAVNDWQDRHVDAINEPDRPIPSGRISPRQAGAIAIAWSLVSALVAALLGPWVFAAAILGLLLSWGYSTPPVRLKRNGWWGNAAVALSYEGPAWFAGAAVLLNAFPDGRIVALAAVYSVGAHGIMTLNDFKAVAGDRETGVASLPARLGWIAPRAWRARSWSSRGCWRAGARRTTPARSWCCWLRKSRSWRVAQGRYADQRVCGHGRPRGFRRTAARAAAAAAGAVRRASSAAPTGG